VSDKGRWQVATYKLVSNNYSIGAINTWVSSYVKLSIPIGSWRVDYAGNGQLHSTAAGARLGFFAIGGTSTLTLVDANYTNETLSQVPYQSNVSDALGYGGGGANINISTMEVFTYKCAITAATGTESFNDCYNGAITKIYAEPSGL
jgi:flagellar hook-associated protein FlgK